MNQRDREQKRADALDAFLTARMRGEPLPAPEDLPPHVAELGAELIQLARQMDADPQYVVDLEAHLNRVSRPLSSQRNKQQARTDEESSIWPEWIRRLTMKKSIYALGAVAAMLVVAVLSWTLIETMSRPGEPAQVAEEGETAVAADLPLLPALETAQIAQTGAAGLGGGAAGDPIPGDSRPLDLETMPAPDFTAIFSDVTFTLDTTLPATPSEALVQQTTPLTITAEIAQQLAAQFGFPGPVYEEVLPPHAAPDAAPAQWQRPPTYFAFADGARLRMSGSSFNYVNDDVSLVPGAGADEAQAVQVAETFLRERGLLDYPHELRQGFLPGEVRVLRLVDGRLLDDPVLFAQVGGDGRVGYVGNYRYRETVADLGRYPLRSAAEAWRLIQDGVVANEIPFNIRPDMPAGPMPTPVEPPGGIPLHWARQYEPGDAIDLYGFPLTFRPLDAAAPPRVELNQYTLSAPAAELEALAEQAGAEIHLWGRLGAEGESIRVEGWEPRQDTTFLGLDGTIQVVEGQVRFRSDQGETYILPDAPQDIPDGLEARVFAWESRDEGLDYPALVWQTISERVDNAVPGQSDAQPMPLPQPGVPAPGANPYEFEQVTVDAVRLIYKRTMDRPAQPEQNLQTLPPLTYIQPVWQFSGHTDNGDVIEFFVQAVDPAYLK